MPRLLTALVITCLLLPIACTQQDDPRVNVDAPSTAQAGDEPGLSKPDEATRQAANTGTIILAGGCFWCMETPFEKLDGVESAVSGYIGGSVLNPTYEQICSGTTGHAEAVLVTYDPAKLNYDDLLQVFWRTHDPSDAGGSFYDRGTQYRTAIFVSNAAQRSLAEASKAELDASGRFDKPIATTIEEATTWYPAEDYHQDYYKKNPQHYWAYRRGSGRDQFIKAVWGDEATYIPVQARTADTAATATKGRYMKPSEDEIRAKLTDQQYYVTQQDGTERPFQNAYWDNKKPGIYVDVVSGEPLFASTDKFDSGTGWPSFTKPLVDDNVKELKDSSHGMVRVEVRSTHGDSHLGHVFDDGPAPSGMRYCINSASLRFIPVAELDKEGYAEFKTLFGD